MGGGDLPGSSESCIRWDQIPHGKGQFSLLTVALVYTLPKAVDK